uniref:Leucine-rich repeat-containing N-terminal plant-type domain-containing protein n=1 Tax=Cucumis sativus TaxID=3659 RepID=A0A0A0LA56_CUCSA
MWSMLLPLDNNVVFGRCLEDQQSLLLELKNNLVYDSSLSKKLVHWNESVDYCNWNGVNCNDGCVIGLDLSKESIFGGIDNSSSLFSLRFLRTLNLGFNSFNSSMPSGFNRLSNLSLLNMSNSGFDGQIPIEISNLTGLVSLDLSTSFLFQVSTLKLENPNLMTFVQNLSNLRVLILDGVDLSAQGREWCKAFSSSPLLNLRVLSLSRCSLNGPLDPSLVKLPSLSVIRLDINIFSSRVPEEFAEFLNLTVLQLGTTRLLGVFPQSIFKVPNLHTIDLSNNDLLQGSLPDFQFNGAFQTLVLQGTKFSGTLPESIGYFENLTRLDLASCNFVGSIPNSILNLTQLTYLDLSSNKFVGPVPSFSQLKNLTVLNLAHNRLNGSLLSTKWEELPNLVNLDLRNNSITGNVPSSLFNLQTIRKIQLNYNLFSGSLNELSNVSSFLLDTLDLESNRLEGPFPMSFLELQGLKILSLSFNNFTGRLNLTVFKQLKNITRLELSSNSLSVETESTDSSSFPQMTTLKLASCNLRMFPGFLKNQSKLNTLDLSHNDLQGEIPLWIWGLENLDQLNLSCNSLVGFEGPPKNLSSSLYLLDLHSNKFEGPLSFFPSSAAYLDFSNNSFSSAIIPAIGQYLSSTVFFSLSRNRIQGNIPESICDSKSLQVLDLSNNDLSGMFPQCLTEKNDNLVVLNLRENALNGSIPNAFPANCGLRTLDLSGNNIEGRVPKSLSNCRYLEVLDLGKNSIDDIFPCSLKSISTLRVLVLHSNKFHGKFGCQERNGTWKSLQIVDISRNYFNGRISGKFVEKWKAMVGEEDFSKSRANHLRFNFFKFSAVNYQDTVTITSKGLDVELTKILTVFTSIDFSCNLFNGHIPAEIGELKALYLLNLSHNSLSGEIPSSIGNLSQLGSLDLSSNMLSGQIPLQLAGLSFLSVLNLSYNLLVGMIPIGSQFQTVSEDSFIGNEGLCGYPLPNKCGIAIQPSSSDTMESSENEFEWKYIIITLGFISGAITGVIAGVFLWEKKSKAWMRWASALALALKCHNNTNKRRV